MTFSRARRAGLPPPVCVCGFTFFCFCFVLIFSFDYYFLSPSCHLVYMRWLSTCLRVYREPLPLPLMLWADNKPLCVEFIVRYFFFLAKCLRFFFEKGGNYMPQGFSKARSVYMYIYTRTIGPWYSSYVCVALYLDYVSMKIM